MKKKSGEESLARVEALKAEGRLEEAENAMSGAAKTLCIPHEQPPLPEGTKCFYSGRPAKCWCLFGRSY